MTRAALAFALALGAAACSTSMTRVEHGDSITTGESDYDAFFQSIHDVGKQAKNGASDVKDMKERLASALGADPLERDAGVRAAKARAKKLEDQRVLLHLDLTPGAKLVSAPGDTPIDAADAKALAAIEQAAKEALSLATTFGQLSGEIASLGKQRDDLAGRAAQVFASDHPMSANEVTRELAAAEKAVAEALAASDAQGGASAMLAIELARAVETGGAAAPPKAVEPPKKAAKPASRGAGGPAKPKKPKASDDFDP